MALAETPPMAIEALPFVNWIFWGALAGGTLLAVGLTEWRGGTTRGYRLFMAWLVAVGAAVWLASELGLAPTPATAATAALRQALVWLFAALAAAYLVASLARWPRSGLALIGGSVGVAALAALAIGGGTQSPTLFAAGLVTAAVALGAVNAAMLLGHWYLVTPQLSPDPLRRLIWLVIAGLAVQAVVVAVSLAMADRDAVPEGTAWLVGLRVAVGIVLPVVIAILALRATHAASLQATTGLLYIGLAMVMAGTIGGASLSYLGGVPI